MKVKTRWALGLGLALIVSGARPASQLNLGQYALFPADFNGDGRTDLLYIGRAHNARSGIALADASGAPQMGFQSWNQDYLGINWSLEYIHPVIGDFNGDGLDDVLLQSRAADPAYVILSNARTSAGAVGQLLGISQAIASTALGLNWSARAHKLLAGDFDGDGKHDLLLQAVDRGGTAAIVLADAGGRLFTRTSEHCWQDGPQQCWTDGELGLAWSSVDSTLATGDFDADGKADVLLQGWPDIVGDDTRDPPWVETFRPLSFGVVLSSTADPSGRILRSANQLWDVEGLGTNWSPLLRAPIVADFNGDARADVFLQGLSAGTANQLVLAGAQGILADAVTLTNEAESWSADAVQLVPGRFGNDTQAGFYLQALTAEGTNGQVADVTGKSLTVTPSVLSPPAVGEASSGGLASAGKPTGLPGGGLAGGGASMQSVVTPPSATTAVGATPATASVSQNGSANYSIPIQLPAGTAGLTPELALTYSSGSGNGLVGMGWNLSGLGIIARCPKTPAQDGATQGVQLTAADPYCLNGNRLRWVSGSAHGTAGAVYRTELENFSRVTILTSVASGPASWKVERKDGLIEEYGGTPDSKIAILGNSAVYRVWALSKVSDRADNYWSVTYTNEVATNGSYRPEYILYTANPAGNPATAPYKVVFLYGPRNPGENVISYYGGGLIDQQKRLTQIEYQHQGTPIRKYQLSYQAHTAFNPVSRLSSVQECSASGACMAATTFGWSDTQMALGGPAVGTAVADKGLGGFFTSIDFPPTSMTIWADSLDINGDGIADAVHITRHDANGTITGFMELFIGTATGKLATAYSGSYSAILDNKGYVYDIDDDGKEDYLFGAKWLHQKTDGTYALEAASPSGVGGIKVDVDGDGFLDSAAFVAGALLVRFHKRDGTSGMEATNSTAWTIPAGVTVPVQFQYGLNNYVYPQTLVQADFNGDGLGDLLLQTSVGWRVLYSNGSTYTTGELIVPPSQVYGGVTVYATPIPIDVNGDGCTDIAYVKNVSGQKYWYWARSTCGAIGSSLTIDIATGILASSTAIIPEWSGAGTVSAADVNGDGNQDLVTGAVILLSNGSGFTAYTSWTGAASTSQYPAQFWADRNGDGVLDYAMGVPGSINYEYRPGQGKRANYLVSAVDGFGKSVAFDYQPMTSASVYTRGTGTAGRTQDTQGTMYLVKTMTLSNGIGGTYSQTYSYAGAKRNVWGRGFLGFATRTVVDSRTNFVTVETYNNSVATNGTGWEKVGTLASSVTRQGPGGAIVSDLAQTWSSFTPTGSPSGLYPYVSQSVSKSYELTGVNNPITTATTTATLDGYGTPYDVTTTMVEGLSGISPGSSATQRRYTPPANILNDTAYWCVARPQRLEETRSNTLTHGAAITRISTQVWDAPKCRVTNTTVAPGSGLALHTALEYDAFNNVNKTTVTGDGISPVPIITQASYGANGHLLQSTTNAKGHVTSFAWNVGLGVRINEVDANSLTTTWEYDDFGREKLMIRPDNTRVATSYYLCDGSNSYCGDALLRYVVRKSEQNTGGVELNHLDQFFDVLGRVKYEQTVGFSGALIETQWVFDSRGNVVQKSNPYYLSASPVFTTTSYDNLNRPYQTQRPTSDTNSTLLTESVTYSGLTTTRTDALAKTQSSVNHAWGTVARVTDQAGKHTQYSYNGFGDLRNATDPAGNVTAINYNIRGFKTSSSDRDMGSWSYTYDALGQMLTQVDAKNQTTTFTYDALGRMATRIDHGGGTANTTTWIWDTATKGVGQLKSVASPGGYSETFQYDSKARRSKVTTVANGTSYVFDYTYQGATGKLLTVTYPAGNGTRFAARHAYQNGFLRKVEDYTVQATPTLLWQADAQDARGHVTQEQFGNGQLTTLGFDQTNGRLYTIKTGSGGGTATQNLTYAWDGVGKLTSRQDVNQSLTETFGYDPMYRLTSVQRNGTTTLTMAYNDIGNITSKSDVGAYTYPASGSSSVRPHAVTTAGGNSFTYDANGNMITRSGATVTWSSYNYPTTINQSGGNTSTFYYGADRNRYRQVSVDGGVTEDRVSVGGGTFEKLVRGSTIEYRHFVTAGDKAVAIVKRSAQTGDEKYYLHADHLGSTDVISNQAGSLVVRLSFDAWGKRRGSNWTGSPSAADKTAINATTHRGYTGHEQLDNLNLVHMNGRVYDPVIARFLSADPIIQDPYHSQSFNRYSYVWNNPLNATDPTGFCRDAASRIDNAKGSICPPEKTVQTSTSVQETGQQPGAGMAGQPTVAQAGPVRSTQTTADGRHRDKQDQQAELEEVKVTGTRAAEREVEHGIVWHVFDVVTDFGPGVSQLKGIYEAQKTLRDPNADGLDKTIAVAGILPVGKVLKWGGKGVKALGGAARATTHAHHAWPKYLGGPKAQDLQQLPKSVHDAYHSGLDKILPRQRGTAYYENLSPAARQQMQRDLADYTKAFDAKNGTQLYDSMIRNGFPGP